MSNVCVGRSPAGPNRLWRAMVASVGTAISVAALSAPAMGATALAPQVKSATAPKIVNEGGNGFPQARVVLATPRVAPTKQVTIVITLLKGGTSLGMVGRQRVASSKGYRSRLVKVAFKIPVETARGTYRLRICVLKSCRFVPITRMGLPRGYEGTASAITTTSVGGSSGRVEYTGRLRFERKKPYTPGRGEYDLVDGSGTITYSLNQGDCTASGATAVSLPQQAFSPPRLSVTDGRAGAFTLADGSKLVVDPTRPYYYSVDVQKGTTSKAATRTCTDGSTQSVDIPGLVLLQAGTVPEYDPAGGLEQAVRRLASVEELLGSRTQTNSLGGTDTWNWELPAFD